LPTIHAASLTLRAGPVALASLREQGFEPDLFSTLMGASGGPKWLVLSQLDRVLARDFILPRRSELDMIGSSIGAFRHACLAQSDPEAALERLEQSYIAQCYDTPPGPAEVSRQSREILDVTLGEKGAAEIAAGGRLHSHVIAARIRGSARAEGTGLKLLLGASAALNACWRPALGLVFERALFSSAGSLPPRFEHFNTHALPLRTENLRDAILASGSIPLVMEPIRNIPHAPTGLYLDGGILDYHFDFRFETRPGLILYPHFFDSIVPGWLDKALPWRAPSGSDLDSVLMISPSPRFVATLPGGRVPDRTDFETLSTDERQRRWHEIVDRCQQLADEFHDLISTGRIVDAIEPFPHA